MAQRSQGLEDFVFDQLTSEILNDPHQEYMSPEIQAGFVAALNEWKRVLIEESQQTLDNIKNQELSASDLSDQATQEESFSLYLKERDRERKLLNKIDEALHRLETQEYGYCCACGVEIGYERLLARLTATMCIDCKSAQESFEKHKSF